MSAWSLPSPSLSLPPSTVVSAATQQPWPSSAIMQNADGRGRTARHYPRMSNDPSKRCLQELLAPRWRGRTDQCLPESSRLSSETGPQMDMSLRRGEPGFEDPRTGVSSKVRELHSILRAVIHELRTRGANPVALRPIDLVNRNGKSYRILVDSTHVLFSLSFFDRHRRPTSCERPDARERRRGENVARLVSF